MNYSDFLIDLDKRLVSYFAEQSEFVFCKQGCSACCEKGDYPLSQVELEYMMQGYIALDNETKKTVQDNIKSMEKGGKCPFLIDKSCSVYKFRPIVCRVHGLAYLCKENTVKLPYCVNDGKNFSEVYSSGEVNVRPIKENLDTPEILKNIDCGEIRNLYDWLER